MPLEEREYIDGITYRDSGYIEVRKVLQVLKDGVEISRQYHRHVVSPDADLNNEHEDVRAIGEALQPKREAAAERVRQERERNPLPGREPRP